MRSFLSLMLMSVFSSALSANDYYPNRPEDVFEYTTDFGSSTRVDVVRESYGSYWKLHTAFGGFGEKWIWTNSVTQNLYIYSNYGHQRIANFDDPVGTEYDIIIDSCNHGKSKIVAKGLTVVVPAGVFENVIKIDFISHYCSDAGVVSHYYARDIGLIKWEYLTIAGVHYYEFARGTANGIEYPIRPDKGVEVSGFTYNYTYVADMEPAAGDYSEAPKAYAGITVKNNTEEDIHILYKSSCEYDILIKDSEDSIVYRYLDHIPCTHMYQNTVFRSGESFTLGDYVPLRNGDTGRILPPGDYSIEILTRGSVVWRVSFPIKLMYAL